MTKMTIWNQNTNEFAPFPYVSHNLVFRKAVQLYAELNDTKIMRHDGPVFWMNDGRMIDCEQIRKGEANKDRKNLIDIDQMIREERNELSQLGRV